MAYPEAKERTADSLPLLEKPRMQVRQMTEGHVR